MRFTFGICTGGNRDVIISKIIDSIEREKIPNYEILVVGQCSLDRDKLTVIPFDETQKQMWITRKKNIITQKAVFDNIVYMHDYLALEPGWYDGWLKYGDDFDVCMNVIQNKNGERFRDWIIAPWCTNTQEFKKETGLEFNENILPYHANAELFNQIMYFSGSYWVAKKSVMNKVPLDDNLKWGDGEDVEWSHRIRNKYIFKLNAYSSVKILIDNKDVQFSKISNEKYCKLELNIKTMSFKDTCYFCKQ